MASLIKLLKWLHSKYILKDSFNLFHDDICQKVEYVLSQEDGKQILLRGFKYTLNNGRMSGKMRYRRRSG